MLLKHYCDGCDAVAVLTPDEAYDLGWDYPPRMGAFGLMAPRLCPNCDVTKSVWWALNRLADGSGPMLTRRQTAIMRRVAGEPESILVVEGDANDG